MITDSLKIRLIKFKIPRYVTCSFCGKKQPFKKKNEHYKLVKDINLSQSVMLKVRVIYAKCKNPVCQHNNFMLPTPGFVKYQKEDRPLPERGPSPIYCSIRQYTALFIFIKPAQRYRDRCPSNRSQRYPHIR
ncbi:MAG: hypothetical protein COX96_09295 [Candidatus Omnitrophica bacterium CG_4_10_14_0_2_um_filter_44_9]|nr:MAG: hypothetical protein AUJ70_05645 [Candidatus Omnitrophica bacterium CG1_02_40_15]PIZ83006.1 MAG: hypothetical protein COX96_09295 [Candidatus Omnitrophica bacterium CG_4_10_14_0_2_um_filter_44_9]